MPWRTNRNPYRIWVSEILLQQTQVETVRPYYSRFIKAFPTVKQLANAELDDVLKAWEGCGYYARARNLHKAAKLVMEAGGKLPTTYNEWLKLPGIGPYTAAAIASIAYDEPVAVVDGNVKRVLARVLNESRLIEGKVLQRLERTAEAMIKSGADDGLAPGDVNQAMMEIGATVCRVTSANCTDCPLAADCRARRVLEDVTTLPRKQAKQKLPHYNIGAALIRKGNKILITQRPEDGLLGGLWEFPGGKQEKGETLPECVRREIREELGIEIEVGKPFLNVDHGFTHFKITLHTFDCRHISGRIRRIGIKDYRWVTTDELQAYAFPKADRVIIEKLLAGQ